MVFNKKIACHGTFVSMIRLLQDATFYTLDLIHLTIKNNWLIINKSSSNCYKICLDCEISPKTSNDDMIGACHGIISIRELHDR